MLNTKLTADDTLISLGQEQLIAVLRTESAEDGLWVAERLLGEGMPCVEITQTIPDSADLINKLSEKFEEALIGAGSVLTLDDMKNAISAGANFIVSPVMNPELIKFGRKKNILTIVGTSTPTEIYNAYDAGAQAVKLFPASKLGGVDYIKAIQAPLCRLNMPLIPTGGVGDNNFTDYLKLGCWAVGLGSGFIKNNLIEERNELAVINKAENLLETYKTFKSQPAKTDKADLINDTTPYDS